MILYANGCSWTAGGGLELILGFDENRTLSQIEEIKSYTWSAHLGKLLGADKVINHGRGCGSNQRIIRTTFNFLYNMEYDPKDVVVGIQWSQPTRFEFYQNEQYSENFGQQELVYIPHLEDNNEKWRSVKIGRNERNYENVKNNIKEVEFTDRFLTMYTNELTNNYSLLTNVCAMSEILKQFGIEKYFFWSEKNFYRHQLVSIENFLKNFPIFFINDTNIEYLSDSHPGLLGHRQIAEILYGQFFNKKDLQ